MGCVEEVADDFAADDVYAADDHVGQDVFLALTELSVTDYVYIVNSRSSRTRWMPRSVAYACIERSAYGTKARTAKSVHQEKWST